MIGSRLEVTPAQCRLISFVPMDLGEAKRSSFASCWQGYSLEDVYTVCALHNADVHAQASGRGHPHTFTLQSMKKSPLVHLRPRGHDGHGVAPLLTGAYGGSLNTKLVVICSPCHFPKSLR